MHLCGLLTVGSVCVESRIIGRGIRFFATHSTLIQWHMNPNSRTRNWVGHYPAPLVRCWFVCVNFAGGFCAASIRSCLTSTPVRVLAGQLVWRRFAAGCTPSHHALQATCLQLLPVIEMYCKYILQEDCSNLWALMVRFDCEAELSSHDLGRSMLAMLHADDDDAPRLLPAGVHMPARVSPFDAIRTSLAAMDVTLQTMRPQVQLAVDATCLCSHEERACCNVWHRALFVVSLVLAPTFIIQNSLRLCYEPN